MASGGEDDFVDWLTGLFNGLGLDGDVYGSYIGGTLSSLGDASLGEVEESLEEILDSCLEGEKERASLTKSITDEWIQRQRKEADTTEGSSIQDLLVATAQPPQAASSSTGEGGAGNGGRGAGLSKVEKERLMVQYDLQSDEEEEAEVSRHELHSGVGDSFRNLNAASVQEKEKTRREEQRTAHKAKLERDQMSKEKQKAKLEERKEKEKKRTQKQERRR